MTRFFAAWNSVKNIQGFTTTVSGTNTTPLDAPASLPPAGVATADEALDYYVRFTTFDGGTTLTLDGNQLFALESYSFGASEPLSGVLSSGKVAFNALHLSFGDAALDPRLFVQLASETALMEVDILGYRPSDGALISDNSFGLVEGASLTIDQSGVAQYSAQYGSAELQHYSTLPGGAPIADSSAAWNSVKNIQGFSADGTNTSTPVAAPTTLPATGVAPAAAEDLDYYVRFTAYNGATLTLDGNQLFALASYSFGATTPLDGLQPSGHVAFNALQLSFGDAALNPSLFALLASGTAIKEIDVLGYRADGALISDNNFGLLVGTSLTIDQSGVAQYAAQFGSVELQHYSALPDGSLVADGPAAWNSLQNDQTFSTSGSGAGNATRGRRRDNAGRNPGLLCPLHDI